MPAPQFDTEATRENLFQHVTKNNTNDYSF